MHSDSEHSKSVKTCSFKEFIELLSTDRRPILPMLNKRKSQQTLSSITHHANDSGQHKDIQLSQNIKHNIPTICRSQGVIALQTQQQDQELPNQKFKQLIDSPSYKSSHNIATVEKSSFSQHFRITSQKNSPQTQAKKINMIRNHQLFIDVVKNSERQQNDIVCPYSPQVQKSHQQIINGYLKDLAQKRRIVQKPQGIDARLDFETEFIYQAVTTDYDLAKKFTNKSGTHIRQIFRNILATGYDQQIYLDLNRLRSIHLALNLKNVHFFRFKYHFMNRFMQMGIAVEQLFKCCERIENVRPYILNEKMEYDIYGGQDGIEICANQMYAKIFADITLAYYFVGIDRATQASKFAKLFFQLIYHMDSPNYTNEVLRERHVKYELTYVQLTNFKFYLSLTMQELGVPFKYGTQLLRRMDIYKYAVINKNSLQDYICNYGYNQFIEQFVRSCLEEPVLYDLIQRRGRQKFTLHCENIFHYFFRYNVKAITLDDLEEIHYHKTIITDKIFMKLKEKAMLEVGKLTDDRIVLEDFDEDWDEIKPLILSDPRMTFLKNQDRDTLIDALANHLENEMYSRQLNVVYETEEIPILRNLKCKLNLLIYTIKFFKRTDLEVIHRRFKISESQYFDFQQCFKSLLEKIPELHYIHGLLEEYKKYIVFD